MAKDAIDSRDLALLVKDTITSLKATMESFKAAFNAHTHVTYNGPTQPVTFMKLTAEARFKSFRVEVFSHEGGLGDIKIIDVNGSKTDRIGRRKLRKAKKVLIPATTMWFKSGYKEQMDLAEFLALTLKK